MTDYYTILGVLKSATDEDIRKAYRTQTLKWHPDKHQNSKESEDQFLAIQQAYQTLGDPQLRATYDLRSRVLFRSQGRGVNETLQQEIAMLRGFSQITAHSLVFGGIKNTLLFLLSLSAMATKEVYGLFLGILALLVMFGGVVSWIKIMGRALRHN